jgi:hypothetical protein
MKNLFWMFVLLTMLVAACTPQAEPTQQPVLPVEDAVQPTPVPTNISVDLTAPQRGALLALSKLTGLTVDKITLISTEPVTWPDSCLGVQRAGMMCAQALVEGFRIVLEANGQEYEFHTNQTGSAVVLAMGEQAGSAAREAVIDQLAKNLGLNKENITVDSVADVQFADGCLDVAMPDIVCAQVETPGQIIVLEANDIQYEYHVSEDGSRIQPATLALTWKREGGIAGFCDNMIVFRSGEVYVSSCKGQPNGGMGTFATLLTAQESEQFNTWLSEFGQVEVDASDPEGVSDRMIVTLTLFGRGAGQPAESDEQTIMQWAQNIFQKMGTQ